MHTPLRLVSSLGRLFIGIMLYQDSLVLSLQVTYFIYFFSFPAREIHRLKWNWFFLIALTSLDVINYSSPLSTLHQFIINPSAQVLNGTTVESSVRVYFSSCHFTSWVCAMLNVPKMEIFSRIIMCNYLFKQDIAYFLKCLSCVQRGKLFHKGLCKVQKLAKLYCYGPF